MSRRKTPAICQWCGDTRKVWPFRYSPNAYVPCPDCTGYTGPGSELCGPEARRRMDRLIYGTSFEGPDGKRIDPDRISPA